MDQGQIVQIILAMIAVGAAAVAAIRAITSQAITVSSKSVEASNKFAIEAAAQIAKIALDNQVTIMRDQSETRAVLSNLSMSIAAQTEVLRTIRDDLRHRNGEK
jgi:uncharacterized protein (DUF1778 family)